MIYTFHNMTSQEFQHGVESQLIEVMKMKMKMQRIQSVLIANLIQMKLMKVIHTGIFRCDDLEKLRINL
jgi:hypothetical protein